MSEGVWQLLDRNFASLEQLNEFFNVWRRASAEPEDEWEVEQVRLQAIERFRKRAAAAEAAASQPMPQPKPPPDPLPEDATDDQRAQRLYGPRDPLSAREAVTPQVSPAAVTSTSGEAVPPPQASGSDSTPPLPVGDSRRSTQQKADDQAALDLYGSSVLGVSFGARGSKTPNPENTEEADVKKANLSKARQHERAMNKKFEEQVKKPKRPAESKSQEAK